MSRKVARLGACAFALSGLLAMFGVWSADAFASDFMPDPGTYESSIGVDGWVYFVVNDVANNATFDAKLCEKSVPADRFDDPPPTSYCDTASAAYLWVRSSDGSWNADLHFRVTMRRNGEYRYLQLHAWWDRSGGGKLCFVAANSGSRENVIDDCRPWPFGFGLIATAHGPGLTPGEQSVTPDLGRYDAWLRGQWVFFDVLSIGDGHPLGRVLLCQGGSLQHCARGSGRLRLSSHRWSATLSWTNTPGGSRNAELQAHWDGPGGGRLCAVSGPLAGPDCSKSSFGFDLIDPGRAAI